MYPPPLIRSYLELCQYSLKFYAFQACNYIWSVHKTTSQQAICTWTISLRRDVIILNTHFINEWWMMIDHHHHHHRTPPPMWVVLLMLPASFCINTAIYSTPASFVYSSVMKGMHLPSSSPSLVFGVALSINFQSNFFYVESLNALSALSALSSWHPWLTICFLVAIYSLYSHEQGCSIMKCLWWFSLCACTESAHNGVVLILQRRGNRTFFFEKLPYKMCAQITTADGCVQMLSAYHRFYLEITIWLACSSSLAKKICTCPQKVLQKFSVYEVQMLSACHQF